MLRYYWWWLLRWSVPWPYPGSGVLRCRQSYLLHQCLASSKIKPFGCTCMQHGYKYWEGGTTSCSACRVDQQLQASWWQQIFEMWLIVMPQTSHDTTIWLCLVANEEINHWLIGKQLTINNAQPISVEANKLSITHYQHEYGLLETIFLKYSMFEAVTMRQYSASCGELLSKYRVFGIWVLVNPHPRGRHMQDVLIMTPCDWLVQPHPGAPPHHPLHHPPVSH